MMNYDECKNIKDRNDFNSEIIYDCIENCIDNCETEACTEYLECIIIYNYHFSGQFFTLTHNI